MRLSGYNTAILIQSGLSNVAALWGYILFTIVQALATIVGMLLVDRKRAQISALRGYGRPRGSLVTTALLFHRSERPRVDAGPAVQTMLEGRTDLTLNFTSEIERQWLTEAGQADLAEQPTTLIIYSYGDFSAVTPAAILNHGLSAPIQLSRSNCVPANKVLAFFSDPFGNLKARAAPLHIQHALITPLPSSGDGWIVAISLFAFAAFYALGPGICVWLALYRTDAHPDPLQRHEHPPY